MLERHVAEFFRRNGVLLNKLLYQLFGIPLLSASRQKHCDDKAGNDLADTFHRLVGFSSVESSSVQAAGDPIPSERLGYEDAHQVCERIAG